jgi:integrase
MSSVTYTEAARIVREAVRDKAYRAFPMGGEWASFMRWGRGQWTESTYRDYESCGDKLAREFPDLEIGDFEPPVGTQRIEEFLDKLWGDAAPRTYNKNLSIVKSFFRFEVLKGKLHGDPSLHITPHKKRAVHRETFNDDASARILADGPSEDNLRRDWIALRLLLFYGLRKGALKNIQYKHFDASRKRLTIFTKGGKNPTLPLPDAALWDDLAKLQFDLDADPNDYLMCRTKNAWRGYNPDGSSRFQVLSYPEIAMGDHGLHNWWYACLNRAGIVPKGTTSGERMHKARHTAGQRILDVTKGNIKAVQKQLGHASIQTTADIYTDWDIDAQEQTMREVLGE